MSYHLVALGFLGVSGAYMSWSDMVSRRLPNLMTGALAVAGLCTSVLMLGLDQSFSNLLHVLIALGIGFLVFATSLIGSGDAKYYAAVAAWFPLVEALQLLSWVALTGFLIACIWLIKVRLEPAELADEPDFQKVPFGIAIAAGAFLAMVNLVR